jgi:hypothetical protein
VQVYSIQKQKQTMKSFSVILLFFIFAIVHLTEGAVRGTTSVNPFEELQTSNAGAEPRKLKGDKKGGGTTGGNTGGGTAPAPAPAPAVECEGCCCSLKNGVSKCCGKTCANGLSCLA